MGDWTEGYVYSNELVDEQYHKIIYGPTANELDSIGKAVMMNVVFDGCEPFVEGDHVLFKYEADGQHFTITKVRHI